MFVSAIFLNPGEAVLVSEVMAKALLVLRLNPDTERVASRR
jgi:hypothetical protein